MRTEDLGIIIPRNEFIYRVVDCAFVGAISDVVQPTARKQSRHRPGHSTFLDLLDNNGFEAIKSLSKSGKLPQEVGHTELINDE